MFDFLGGLGGGLLGQATNMFTNFLGDNKPETPAMMPNMQKKGGNYLLDSMSPEVAGVFQQQYNVNPQGFAMQPKQGERDVMGILQSLNQSGLLDQEQPQLTPVDPMIQYSPRAGISPVDLQQYYKNLMSKRQGLL